MILQQYGESIHNCAAKTRLYETVTFFLLLNAPTVVDYTTHVVFACMCLLLTTSIKYTNPIPIHPVAHSLLS